MKKLLFLITTLEGGGAEKVLVNLVNNLDTESFEISIITLIGGGVHESELAHNIIYKPFLTTRSLFIRKLVMYIMNLLPARVVYNILVNKKYDYEISYLEGSPTKIISNSCNRSSRKIAFVHTDFSNNYNLVSVYSSTTDCLNSYKNFDTVVFVSGSAESGFKKFIGLLHNGRIIHNIIDEKEILFASNDRIENKKPDSFLFVSVGRLCYEKGYDRLMQAVAEINRENLNFEVWILGEGNDRKLLEDLKGRLGLRNVRFLGFKNNPYPYIKLADAFICTSRVEGYSTVVSEAIVLKKAVLTTNVSGMSEILDNGKFGLIVDNNINGIINGMKKFLLDPEGFNNYQKLASQRSKYFHMRRNIVVYEDLFSK